MNNPRVLTGFVSGKDWLGLSGTAQASYAVGVVDGLDLAATLKPQGLIWINSCVTGMTSDQVRAMLKAELDARSDERDLPMVHRAMYQALWKACRHGISHKLIRNGRMRKKMRAFRIRSCPLVDTPPMRN